MTRIKICGITSIGDALAAVGCGADAVGFVFAPSPRQIAPADAAAIVRELPPFVTAVAVTVDDPLEALRQKLAASGCHAVQLHGEEPPEYIDRLARWRVIKAFRVQVAKDLRRLPEYARADAFLLDSRVAGKAGGTGVTFDWRVAREVTEPLRRGAAGKPIILAGGLTPDNVAAALEAVRPYAVDVSTGVEVSPGKKDRGLMRAFAQVVREFDAAH